MCTDNLEQQRTTSQTDTDAERRPPVVVEFETAVAVTPPTPDHDPHGAGEVPSEFVFSSCDIADCETTGLVPVTLLEDADGFLGRPPFDVVCLECGDTE